MLHGSVGSSENKPKDAQARQLNRACEACRISKVRCLVSPESGSSQCQRCAKAGRACVFAPPVKRRQRKRTDVRVTELEKEIKQMRSLLQSNQISPEAEHEESMDEGSEHQLSGVEKESSVNSRSQTHESTATPATGPPTDNWQPTETQDKSPLRESFGSSDTDIIDRGLITLAMADELLNIYRRHLAHEYPGVVIPSDWTAADLRSKKPAVFHAVMAASSLSKGLALSVKLHEEVVYLYARSLFIKGEKSLQCIQALIITVAYYSPPNTPAQLQIYQFGNMAASMALELGLASKPRTHEQLPKRAIRSLQRISSAEELLEHCRTMIVLYIMTAGFAVRLRRPNILPYNSWMDECLVLLQKSSLQEDKRIVSWIKLQRIADEANTAFGFDDASTSFSLSELRLQVILRIFERRMEDWKKSVPREVMNLSLTIEYYQNMITMCEFGMDGGRYDAPDFRNRHLTLPALDDDCVQPESLLSGSALQINATIKCIGAAHSLLDCFVSLALEKLQRAPNVIFVRALYALVALMKVDYAISTDAHMSEVLESQSLRVDFYLETVLQMTTDAIGEQKCRIPSYWAYVMEKKLKSWYDEYQTWRSEGRHLKRKQAVNNTVSTTDTPSEPVATQGPIPAQQVPLPNSSSADRVAGQNPYFGLSDPYPVWPSNGIPLATSTGSSAQNINDQATFPSSTGDVSAAFQNGDLYLWNDMMDNFGPWFPQGSGGSFNDMRLDAFNGSGMG